MSHPIIRECDHYLIMEPSKDERFLTKEETLQWLENWLNKMDKLSTIIENFQKRINGSWNKDDK